MPPISSVKTGEELLTGASFHFGKTGSEIVSMVVGAMFLALALSCTWGPVGSAAYIGSIAGSGSLFTVSLIYDFFYVFGDSPWEFRRKFIGDPEEISQFIGELNQFYNEAKVALSVFPSRAYKPQPTSLKEIASTLLENADGFCMGESHNDQSAIQFLENHLNFSFRLKVAQRKMAV